MTDPTDKNSNENLGQMGRHESLHSRLESIDKKLKEKQVDLDVDLDALLDEAEYSLSPMNDYPDDEDAIDRLLMNAGFDVDDALLQSEQKKDGPIVKDGGLHDDLDIFLGFDGFGEDSFGLVKSQTIEEGKVLSPEPLDAVQQDDDELDRLLMDTALDADLDGEKVADDGAASGSGSPSQTDTEEDDFSAFFDMDDDFDGSNLPSEDDTEASGAVPAPLAQEPDNITGQVPDILSDGFDEIGRLPEIDGVDDDFDELDLIPDSTSSTGLAEANAEIQPDADLTFDESDLIGDDTLSELTDEKQEAGQPVVADLPDELDGLVGDFDGSDLMGDDTLPELADEEPSVGQAAVSDEIDDFSSIDDDTGASDLIQDDELASADLFAANEGAEGLSDDDDNLFMEATFDAGDQKGQKAGEIDEFGDDADDFFQLDEISDDFSHTAGTPTEEKPSSVQDHREDDFLLPDFDITAGMEISDDIELPKPIADVDKGVVDAFAGNVSANEKPVVDPPKTEANNAESKPNQTVASAVNVSGIDKKALETAETKAKKAKLFAYVSLGIGAVALVSAAGLGYMAFGAKSELSKLTEKVTALEANLAKSAANSPSQEIDAMRNSVVQLNQQFDGFVTELKGIPQFPPDLLDDKLPGITAQQYLVSKALDMLQVKMGDLEQKASSVPAVVEPPKVEVAHVPEPVKEEAVPIKTEVVHGHEPAPVKEEATHELAPTKERALHEITSAKEDVAPEPVKVKIPPKPVIVDKPAKPVKVVPKLEHKPEPVPVEKVQEAPGKWGVNLVAVKHEWFAKSQAAKFAEQGIYTEVVPVQSNNTTMYRLRVSGFKTKKEADANTARIKKTLNLDHVWVSDN